ncbi:GlcG/HbpS family heme-binding protein [Thiohalorhabdus sp. Cl-TMA]|uniref:Heme-binding protein n=1 Tax=Thiohalorhabdus methylotrophus TaxID=3242694 RepID=A0ABV4TYV9_9GAMM
MKAAISTLLGSAVLALTATPVQAEEATFNNPSLVPEVAMKAVKAAVKACREQETQVTAAVVDEGGNTQALMRDRYAGPHTVDTAISKAWTAVSFRTDTLELRDITEPGKSGYGIQNLPNVTILGGGKQIMVNGRIAAGIGVSGAPSGGIDDQCATAGIDAIQEELL